MKKVIVALMLAGVIGGVGAESATKIEQRLCKQFGDAVEITHAHTTKYGSASASKLWADVPPNTPVDQQVMYLRWAGSVVVMADVLVHTPNKEVANASEYFCVMQDMPALLWKRK